MERLKRRSDFRAIAQAAGQGVRAHASAFVLQARVRPQAGPPRVGFTVSRQVGNAVERNRVRRRLRELVRLARPAALCAGHDYVLIGRRAALQAPFSTMIRELAGALARIHASGQLSGQALSKGSSKGLSQGSSRGSNPGSNPGSNAGGTATGASDSSPPHKSGSSSQPPRRAKPTKTNRRPINTSMQ
jgi:ribonuclease P protein component